MVDRETSISAGFSPAQRQRLIEVSLGPLPDEGFFVSQEERDRAFEARHRDLVGENLRRLEELRLVARRPEVRRIEARMVDALVGAGFVEVVTPILISRGSLVKLGLGPDHPLWRQVFWVDGSRCLRPMLAPNLYHLLGRLQRLWSLPVRIFEVGPCFRRESKGSEHLTEFTMLNLVELGPEIPAGERLGELARLAMGSVGMDYELRAKESQVYGATIDVEVGGVEVASGVAGPHPLDASWEISEAWAGWGFGLERLAMLHEGSSHIGRFGRSLVYLDGARLNIQADRRGLRKEG
jgi:pyrrolysyl-tRNA synthetase-like protein